jgi:hypothetical protein
MRPSVNPRVTGDMIRKLMSSLINRLAEPIPPTQPPRITYLHKSGVRRDSANGRNLSVGITA